MIQCVGTLTGREREAKHTGTWQECKRGEGKGPEVTEGPVIIPGNVRRARWLEEDFSIYCKKSLRSWPYFPLDLFPKQLLTLTLSKWIFTAARVLTKKVGHIAPLLRSRRSSVQFFCSAHLGQTAWSYFINCAATFILLWAWMWITGRQQVEHFCLVS